MTVLFLKMKAKFLKSICLKYFHLLLWLLFAHRTWADKSRISHVQTPASCYSLCLIQANVLVRHLIGDLTVDFLLF